MGVDIEGVLWPCESVVKSAKRIVVSRDDFGFLGLFPKAWKSDCYGNSFLSRPTHLNQSKTSPDLQSVAYVPEYLEMNYALHNARL